jgi:hypothetical protein
MLGDVHRAGDDGALLVNLRAGSASELAATRRGPADRLGDAVEGGSEDVVQHEHHALGRCQAFQHDAQRRSDLVVEGHPVGWIDGMRLGCRLTDELDGGRVVRALSPRVG